MKRGTGQSILCVDHARESLEAADAIERLYRVEAPHCCAGLVVVDGKVTEAAPILRRAVMGKTFAELVALCGERGWQLRHILRPVIIPMWLQVKWALEEGKL